MGLQVASPGMALVPGKAFLLLALVPLVSLPRRKGQRLKKKNKTKQFLLLITTKKNCNFHKFFLNIFINDIYKCISIKDSKNTG